MTLLEASRSQGLPKLEHGASRRKLRAFKRVIGASRMDLGASSRVLGATRTVLGASRRILGASRTPGRSRVSLGGS